MSEQLLGLSCQLGLTHNSREDEKESRTMRQGNQEMSERHKLGLIRVGNKTERKGGVVQAEDRRYGSWLQWMGGRT